MRGIAALRALHRGLLRIERAVVGAGILAIAGIGIVNVVARNLFGGSLAFAEEASQACMVWITFAGVGLAARRARHVRMSAFYDQLRGRARKAAWLAILAGTSALLAVLAWLAVSYVVASHAVGGVTPALRVPLWLVHGVVPAGLALGALEYALALVRNLERTGIHASVDLEEGADALEDAT